MTIRIGDVWDRTAAVISGRSGILFGIAALTVALPTIVHDGWVAYAGASAAAKLVAALLSLVAFVLTIWGMLAMIAVASDPAVDRSRGLALGGARLPAAIGVIVVLVLALVVLAMPLGVLLAASGFDYTRAQAGLQQSTLSPGAMAGVFLYGLLLAVALFWVGARLFALYPVIQDERRGLGAIRRSFALTRGYTWKLIGVLILYLVVFLVVLAAAGGIVGVVVGLILGREQAATTTFVVSIVTSLVTAGFAILQAVFPAQFYLAAVTEKDGVAASVAPA